MVIDFLSTISYIVAFNFFFYVDFVYLLVSGVRELYQKYANSIFKSLYLSHFKTYIETFSSQNAFFNRKKYNLIIINFRDLRVELFFKFRYSIVINETMKVRNCETTKVRNNGSTKQRKYETAIQQKYETTEVRNNEIGKLKKYEKTTVRNNGSTKLRKYEKRQYEITTVQNNQSAKHRNNECTRQRKYRTTKMRNCETTYDTTNVWNNKSTKQ